MQQLKQNTARVYRPRITTVDLWPEVVDHIGSDRHASLIDQIAACLGLDDEELLVRLKNRGSDQSDVARDLNVSQQAISSRFRRILNRADRCYCEGDPRCPCFCHEARRQRHAD